MSEPSRARRLATLMSNVLSFSLLISGHALAGRLKATRFTIFALPGHVEQFAQEFDETAASTLCRGAPVGTERVGDAQLRRYDRAESGCGRRGGHRQDRQRRTFSTAGNRATAMCLAAYHRCRH